MMQSNQLILYIYTETEFEGRTEQHANVAFPNLSKHGISLCFGLGIMNKSNLVRRNAFILKHNFHFIINVKTGFRSRCVTENDLRRLLGRCFEIYISNIFNTACHFGLISEHSTWIYQSQIKGCLSSVRRDFQHIVIFAADISFANILCSLRNIFQIVCKLICF